MPIVHLHRATNVPHIEPGAIVTDDQAEALLAQACAEEGGTHREPSGTTRNTAGPWLGLLLALLCWLPVLLQIFP